MNRKPANSPIVVFNFRLFLAVFLVVFILPGQAKARQYYSRTNNQWRERTGTADFHDHLINLFYPHSQNKIQSLTQSGGPVRPSCSSDTTVLLIDTRGILQGRFRSDPLQLPAPVFDFRPQELEDANLRWQFATGFQLALPAGFSLLQRTLVGSHRSFDPTSRTKDYRQIDANIDIPLATINFNSNNFHIWVGRNWEKWGPGWTGSAILDSQFPSPDGFGATYTGKSMALRYRGGRIDDMLSEDINFHRYFFGHRVDFLPLPNLRIGLSETALVATDGAMPLWALNPLLPWVMSEQEKRGSMEKTNIIWALDAVWNPEQWAVYGQFLLDDYMIDLEDRDTYPDQLGIMFGIAHEKISSTKQTTQRMGFEYNRIWSWTYVHRDPELIYQAWNSAIGHPAGNDSESITTFWTRTRETALRSLSLFAGYHRQGQVWLGTSMDPVGSPGLPFPVPPVSTWWQLGLDLEYQPHSAVDTRLRLGWSNPDIQLATDSTTPPPDFLGASSQWQGSISVSLNFGAFTFRP